MATWWVWLTDKKISFFIGILSLAVTIFGIIYGDLKSWVFPPPRVITCSELIVSRNFISALDVDVYISQPVLEEELSAFIGIRGKEYIVVNGPKGAGKSTLVNNAILQQPFGVISLSLVTSASDLYNAFANDVCESKDTWGIKNVGEVLRNVTEYGRRKLTSADWVPTLVVEVDRASTDASVHQIARDIKLLCVDQGVCRGIIILSNALAAFALPKDPRVEMLWVDDFSIEQANQYFDSLGFLLGNETSCPVSITKCAQNNTEMRQYIYDSIGTRPIDLIRLVDKTRRKVSLIGGYVEQFKQECKVELLALFGFEGSPSGSMFEELAHMMVNSFDQSISLGNLPPRSVFTQVDKVAIILKQRHAMMYHFPTRSYRFASKCIANAAVEWSKSAN